MVKNSEIDDVGSPLLRVLHREELSEQIEVTAEFVTSEATCPRCGTVTDKVHDRRTQRKRDEAEDMKPVWLSLQKRRFRCTNCGAVFTEPDPLSGPRRRSTQRLRATLREAASENAVKQVARVQQVSRVTVYRALNEAISRKNEE